MSVGNWDRIYFVLYEKYFILKLLIGVMNLVKKKFRIYNVRIIIWLY